MGRRHIEFFQTQMLPWQTGLYAGNRTEAESKTLSVDDESGAASLLIRYPAGWSQGGTGHLKADEELFVLDGALEVNGQHYGEHGYGHFPAGYARQSFEAPGGAVVLTFFSAVPEYVDGAAPEGLYDPKRLVERGDAKNEPYDDQFERLGSAPREKGGPNLKLLREDPYNRNHTWLLRADAHLWGGGLGGVTETHPTVEEMFLVFGENVGPYGPMKTGAYFWRPGGIEHGPFGLKAESLHFFRTLGGPLSTEFQDSQVPFDWDVQFRPTLPPELAHLANQEWSESEKF